MEEISMQASRFMRTSGLMPRLRPPQAAISLAGRQHRGIHFSAVPKSESPLRAAEDAFGDGFNEAAIDTAGMCQVVLWPEAVPSVPSPPSEI